MNARLSVIPNDAVKTAATIIQGRRESLRTAEEIALEVLNTTAPYLKCDHAD